MTTTHRKAIAPVFLKAVAGEPGVYDCVVSVFGNVDLANERVQPGAFTKTLERWKASGDPIPGIFAHRWDDLNAHVGIVKDSAELTAGDERLAGTGLEANGGLWVRLALDVDDPNAPHAKRLDTLMQRRSIREFSFAFDVMPGGSRVASDGVVDLTELELFEVGPCLKGMNPATVLLSRKSLETALAKDVGDGIEVGAALAIAELDALLEEVEESLAKDRGPDGEKLYARPSGSVEETLDAVNAAAWEWAAGAYGDDLFYLHLEGTFLEDGRVIVMAERWEDPYGEGPIWELNYTTDDAGTIVIGAAREVEAVLTVEPKARKLAAKARATRSASAGAARATVTPVTAKPEGKAEEPSGAKVEDPPARSDDEPSTDGLTPLGALIEAETATLNL